MELRDVEYFAVIAEHGHLGRAAQTLNISQPALSKSLGRLEAAVGVRLVRRTPKGFVFERLYDIGNVVCAALGHRLTSRTRISVHDLASERWAWAEPTLLPQQRLREVFRDAGLPPPRLGFECRSTALLLKTVARSDLLAMMSESFLHHTKDVQLKILPVKELRWQRPVGFLRRTERYLPPAVQRLVQILRDMATSMTATR